MLVLEIHADSTAVHTAMHTEPDDPSFLFMRTCHSTRGSGLTKHPTVRGASPHPSPTCLGRENASVARQHLAHTNSLAHVPAPPAKHSIAPGGGRKGPTCGKNWMSCTASKGLGTNQAMSGVTKYCPAARFRFLRRRHPTVDAPTLA